MALSDITINGTKVVAPTEWAHSWMDLVTNSNRVGGLTMRFNYIGTKRQISAKWENLTQADYEATLATFEKIPFFPIACYDPREKDVVTRTFYKSDRKGETLKILASDKAYGSFSVTFIEQ